MNKGLEEESLYSQLGVDAGKTSVRKAFGHHIDNEYPYAFVNIIKDPLKRGWVRTQHMDGDGSKFIQRLLNFAETEEPGVFRGAVDDALQMNLGDIAASGFVHGPIMVTDVLNVNPFNVPKDAIMEEIGPRFGELMEIYRRLGFNIRFLGGETADVPMQVISNVLDVAVSAHANRNDIIAGNVQPGDRVYGFASDGQAVWEDEENSGIMSNGLTLGRFALMWSGYEDKYPNLGKYQGRFKVGECAEVPYDLIPSEALISPTRHWAILIKTLLQELRKANLYDQLHGISMNTGGGVTKISHVGKGITYKKEMPTPPALFQLIQVESGEKWKAMYKSFNCGVGLDVVGSDNPGFLNVLRRVSDCTEVKLYEKLGECEASIDGQNHVIAVTKYGVFDYDK